MESITTSINSILKNLIKGFNTLLDCPARFSGDYSKEKVHRFIEYIEYYKRIKCISDIQALRELEYLLIDHAFNWWVRRKVNISSWAEALALLENQYAKKRPANVVYTEILKHHYEDYESKDDFVDDKMELFCELSEPELKEKNKLEIIYALLPKDMQSKIKLSTVSTINELKDQLKLRNLNSVDTSTNTASGPEMISESNIPENSTVSGNKLTSQEKDQIAVVNTSWENNATISERDSIIKVKRTEDLMPQNIKEEKSSVHQEEFLPNEVETATTNNILHSIQDNFQIDTDIMNQINSIIDESEMNMDTSNIQAASTASPQPSNCDKSVGLLSSHKDLSIHPKKSTDSGNESQIKTTKKLKKRCTYCRRFNHTAQVCLKKARHMKMFPEKFMHTEEDNNNSQGEIFKDTAEYLPTKTSTSSISTPDTPLTERLLTIPILLNRLATTSMSVADTLPVVTSSTLILSNAIEKCINPVLTTKLIAPINGRTSNRMPASKSRSINTPSPKCHQCGTLGFYKSICPNCSPIYNNNHVQYNKKS